MSGKDRHATIDRDCEVITSISFMPSICPTKASGQHSLTVDLYSQQVSHANFSSFTKPEFAQAVFKIF